jgi:hypothetical protein
MVSSVESMVHRGVCLGNRLCGNCDSLAVFCAMADFGSTVHLVSALMASVTSAAVQALPRQIFPTLPLELISAVANQCEFVPPSVCRYNWLLKRCPRPLGDSEVEIKLDRTKRVLAAEFGATSETLSRTLAKFRNRKLLQVKGNTLIVKRPDQLRKLLRHHLGEL